MAGKKKQNYLDFIPILAAKHQWTSDEDGNVTIHMVHDGVFDRIAQKFFHRPGISHIKLDELGGFVWRQIDGQHTVGQIADRVKKQFGNEAEPLYDRLVQFMKILYNNGFISYRKKSSEPSDQTDCQR